MDDDQIKRFVKKKLHCTCPDEVFEHIECDADVGAACGIVLDYEINVGNRLLIYVVRVEERYAMLRDVICHLIPLGIRRRDEHRFNRLRLVLVATDPLAVEERACEVFYTLSPDDRVHLHVIGQDELDQIEE